MKLEGKVAVVTGAARGIGRATAIALAGAGARVGLIDVDGPLGVNGDEEITAAGGHARFAHADVSDERALDAGIGAFESAFGPVNIAVNNAALVSPGTVSTMTQAQWSRVLAVNLTGAFLVSQRVLPGMIAAGAGVVINIASITGLVGRAGRVAYCASKGGVIALSRAMAVDHGSEGIRVIAVCPSGIVTDQMADLFKESPDPEAARTESIALHPVGRLAEPSELATFIAYLASDEASFITGSVMTFDGGYTAT